MSDGRDHGRNKLAEAHARDGLISMVGVQVCTCPSTSRRWVVFLAFLPPSMARPQVGMSLLARGVAMDASWSSAVTPTLVFGWRPLFHLDVSVYLAAHTIEALSCAGKDGGGFSLRGTSATCKSVTMRGRTLGPSPSAWRAW